MQLVEDGKFKETPEDPSVPDSRLIFGHCAGCEHHGVIRLWYDGFEELQDQLAPRLGRPDIKLPPLVQESYEEALRCGEAEAWLASAVMVRRTLEAVGRQFDPKARSPVEALKAMKTQGVISDELFEWGEALRFLGNISAHPTDKDRISEQDARDALDLARAIIETIYDLRPKFTAMKQRRAGKSAAEDVESPE